MTCAKHFNKIKILDEVISLYFSRYILKNLSSVNSFLFKYLYKAILFLKKVHNNSSGPHINAENVLWLHQVSLNTGLCVYFCYRMDFLFKLPSSHKPMRTWVPGFPLAHSLLTDCSNLFQALSPASRTHPGRLKSQRKRPCLHLVCLHWHLHWLI